MTTSQRQFQLHLDVVSHLRRALIENSAALEEGTAPTVAAILEKNTLDKKCDSSPEKLLSDFTI